MNGIKQLFFCTLILCGVLVLGAQTPEWQWAVGAGGTYYNSGTSIATDDQGNQYVTGYFSGTATFGPYTLTSSDYYDDIFIAKIDFAGSYLWVVRAGGAGEDVGMGIALDNAGNAYVTGYISGTATFGSTTLITYGNVDIFAAKLDPSGNFLWAVHAGSTNDDFGRGIAVDNAGNAYLTTMISGNATFGSSTINTSGFFDIIVAKLDHAGNFLWVVGAGGTSSENGNGIAVDNSGNIYLTGGFNSTNATFGPFTLQATGIQDMYAAMLDPTGNFIWAVRAGGMSNTTGTAIAVDNSGNSYLTGYFQGYVNFGNYTLVSSGNEDIFAAKLDSTGNFLWVVRAGGTGNDLDYAKGRGIAVDNSGNAYLTGYFQGSASFGPYTLISSGYYDIFSTKINTEGNFLWAIRAGGIYVEDAYGIAVDEAGNAYLTGYFEGPADFGTITLTPTGYYYISNVFTAKLSLPLNANFISNTTVGPEPLSVQFTDISTALHYPITNWYWNFGDGGSSHQQNPTHIYTTPGVYTVTLSVMDQNSQTSTLVRSNYITVEVQIFEIDLTSESTMNFGSVYLEEQSEYQAVTFANTGNMVLTISNVHFLAAPLHFEFVDPFRDLVIAPGETGSIQVRFAPQAVGALSDTLFIVNNSANNPILKVKLTGTGLYVPPKPPENLVIAMDGDNAVITWDAVTQNTHNQMIVPDGYLVFYNGSSDAENGLYYYLAVTNNLTQTHIRVGEFAAYMFYRVVAYKYYGRGVFDITSLGLEPGMPEDEVMRRLRE